MRSIRPRNGDWIFVVFIPHSQNIRLHNENLIADVVENIVMKLKFQSSFSIRLILNKFYRWIIILINKSYCITIWYDLHRSESCLEFLSWINIFCSSGLKIVIEIGISMQQVTHPPPLLFDVDFFSLQQMKNTNDVTVNVWRRLCTLFSR